MKCTKGNHPTREQISGQGRALNSVNDQFLQSGAAKTQQILTDTSLMLIGRFDKPTQDRNKRSDTEPFFRSDSGMCPGISVQQRTLPQYRLLRDAHVEAFVGLVWLLRLCLTYGATQMGCPAPGW